MPKSSQPINPKAAMWFKRKVRKHGTRNNDTKDPVRVALYAAGAGAKRVLRFMPANYTVVAVVDGSVRRHGQLFEGYTIQAPAILSAIEYDRIIVCTTTYAREVYAFLRGTGVEPDKIYTYPEEVLAHDKPYRPTIGQRFRAYGPHSLIGRLLYGSASCRDSLSSMGKSLIAVAVPLRLYPISGGASARVWSLCRFLKESGYSVALIVPPHRIRHISKLLSIAHVVWTPETFYYGSGGYANSWAVVGNMARRQLHEMREKRTHRAPIPLEEELASGQSQDVRTHQDNGPTFFQKRFNSSFEKLTLRACANLRPQAVIATFAWTATVFSKLPDNILKITDTIDVQHLRQQQASLAGFSIPGFDPPPGRDEETAILDNADCILAIQEEERRELQKMLPRKRVIHVGHAHQVKHLISHKNSFYILFVGNRYAPNIDGIQKFIREQWPRVQAVCGKARLVICGGVCDALAADSRRRIVLKGKVPELAPYYAKAAVVINPVLYGTGLKIKSVEALCHGKCLIATPQGILGLPQGVGQIAKVVSFDQMAKAIADSLADRQMLRQYEERAAEFARRHFSAASVYRDFEGWLQKALDYK